MQKQIKLSILLIFTLLTFRNITYSQTTYGGLGATIDIGGASRFPFIVSLMKGMPAEKMNLAPNDFITKINGQSTYNYTIDQVVSQLRGAVGTTCNITIWRNGIEYPLTFTRVAIEDPKCTIYTNALPTFTNFTWSGSCDNGFANGYGKLELINEGKLISYYVGYMKAGQLEGEGIYYYSNGNKMLEGTFSNNQLNGTGKKYDSNGILKFKGYFENDELYIVKQANEKALEIAKVVVDEIFDGGTNIKAKVIGLKPYYGDKEIDLDNKIFEIKISFNGDIVKSNYYEVTMIVVSNSKGTTYQFTDYNDMARGYGLAKLGIQLGLLSKKLDSLTGN